MHQDTTDSDFSRLDFEVTQTPRTNKRRDDNEIIGLIKSLFVEVEKMRKELHDHIKDEKSVLVNAFPDNDPEGHRRAHEAWIKKAEAQAATWIKIKDSVAVWGVIGLLGFILLAVWAAVMKGPK